MDQSDFVSLAEMVPADLREIQEPGLLLPYRNGFSPILVTVWDGEPFAVLLDDKRGYPFFQIKRQEKEIGLFFKAPNIVVNLESAIRGNSVSEDHGVLMLSEGTTHILGQRVGDHFHDGIRVPLWQSFESARSDEVIAFTTWGLAIGVGNERRLLWQRHPVAALAAVV